MKLCRVQITCNPIIRMGWSKAQFGDENRDNALIFGFKLNFDDYFRNKDSNLK